MKSQADSQRPGGEGGGGGIQISKRANISTSSCKRAAS